MSIINTTALVRSKLHMRRSQLLVVCVISSLLFSLLVAVMVAVDSGVRSLDTFNESLYSGRYYALANRFVAEDSVAGSGSDIGSGNRRVYPIQSLGIKDVENSADSVFSQGAPWVVDKVVADPFIAKGLKVDSDAIPILLPYSMAGRLVGGYSNDGTVQQKVDGMQSVLLRARGFEFKQPLSNGGNVLFEVVGLLPDRDIATSSNASMSESLFASIRSPQAGVPIIPKQLLESSKASSRYKDIVEISPLAIPGIRQQSFVVEFSSQKDMANFIRAHDCGTRAASCDDADHQFTISELNTNTIRIDDMRETITKLMVPFTVIATITACIVMAGVFGRVVAGSRKEVAIFRAIGAANSQIVSIFIVYSIVVSFLVGVSAIALGQVWSLLVELISGDKVTQVAYVSYGIIMNNLKVDFFSFDGNAIWWVLPVVMSTGLVSMALVIPSLMKRSVIDDIRSDT